METFFGMCMVYALKFFKKIDVETLHHGILNLVLNIYHKGDYYCFCNEYQGCELRFGQKYYCPICKLQLDFNDIETECDFAQYSWERLTKIYDKLFPYLEEIIDVKPYYDEIYELISPTSGEFYYSHRDNYDGTKQETSLTEMIQMTSNSKSRMGELNYLKAKCDGYLTYESYIERFKYKDED